MAATLVLSETNGAGATVTDGISNLNFGSADEPNIVVASHPIVIGLNSYVKFIRIKVTDMGGSSSIDTLKVYKSAGVLVLGEFIQGNTDDSGGGRYWRTVYNTPDRTPSSGTNEVVTNIATALPSVANLSINAVGSANDGGVDTPAGSITAAGNYSQYWTLMNRTSSNTPAGAVNQKTFTYQWNEA